MTHSTSPLAPARVMRMAWAKFRRVFKDCTFREVGMGEFARCLRWAWARARAMAALVARGLPLLKVEHADVSRRMAAAERAASGRATSPSFVRSMLDERRALASRERWLRAAIAFHPVAA